MSSYAEMEACCREEFKDEDVREEPPSFPNDPIHRQWAETSLQAERPTLP